MLLVKVAVFIDAENIPANYLPYVIRNVRTITNQRNNVLIALYGDWNKPQLTQWKQYGEQYDLDLRHQESFSEIKSTTDMLLAMDGVRLITAKKPDVFCIVANDGDYVPLCEQARLAGCEVVVMATKEANAALLRNADRVFIMRQVKPQPAQTQPKPQPAQTQPKPQPAQPSLKLQPPKPLNRSKNCKSFLLKR